MQDTVRSRCLRLYHIQEELGKGRKEKMCCHSPKMSKFSTENMPKSKLLASYQSAPSSHTEVVEIEQHLQTGAGNIQKNKNKNYSKPELHASLTSTVEFHD